MFRGQCSALHRVTAVQCYNADGLCALLTIILKNGEYPALDVFISFMVNQQYALPRGQQQ